MVPVARYNMHFDIIGIHFEQSTCYRNHLVQRHIGIDIIVMSHQNRQALHSAQFMYTVDAGKDKLCLCINSAKVSVCITGTITDNPFCLFTV